VTNWSYQKTVGTDHRSESGKDGSIIFNQETREESLDQKKEFSPVSLRSNKKSRLLREAGPLYVI
tara:strand:+ start:1381 stop:1575 length:195 start_codon:yes stop_codon:yes gene_type:complete